MRESYRCRCSNCPNPIRFPKLPREGEKFECKACHFKGKVSHAMLSSANVPAVRHDSEPVHRESVPAVRRDSAPIRRESSPSVARHFSAIKQRVVQAVKQDIVMANTKDSAIAVPSWYEAPHGFGQRRPVTDLTPKFTELRVWYGACSGTGEMWSRTYMQPALGQKFRLVDGEDAGTYIMMARANNIHVCDGKRLSFSLADLDLSNYQCVCGWGRISGASRNTFWCETCEFSLCARSVYEPRSAAATAYCPLCDEIGVLEKGTNIVNGVSHIARRD
jgi:hypothetical protein